MKLETLLNTLEPAGYPLDTETVKYLLNCEDIHYHDRLFAINNEFGLIGFVFADCLQDALDTATDLGHMSAFEAEEGDESDDTVYLGNEGKPHNLEYCITKEM